MRPILTLHALLLAVLLPSLAYAQYNNPSGTANRPGSQEPVAPGEPGNLHRPTPEPAMTPKIAIQQAPYNMGQAILNGSYKPRKSAGTHVPEKQRRLGILLGSLPAADHAKVNAKTLANELSDREENALEYYIQVKYGKYITAAPGWAKTEPPIKVTNAR